MPARKRTAKMRRKNIKQKPYKRRRFGDTRFKTRPNRYGSMQHVQCQLTKVHQFKTGWTAGDDTSAARMAVLWDSSLSVVSASTMFINETKEFQAYGNLFRDYQVNGVKIVYKPYRVIQGPSAATDVSMRDSWHASWDSIFETTNPISPTEVWTYSKAQMQPDFKAYTHGKPITKYIGVRKWYKKRSKDGRKTTSTVQNSNLTTYFSDNVDGLNTGTDIGRFHVTWYVTFSNPDFD